MSVFVDFCNVLPLSLVSTYRVGSPKPHLSQPDKGFRPKDDCRLASVRSFRPPIVPKRFLSLKTATSGRLHLVRIVRLPELEISNLFRLFLVGHPSVTTGALSKRSW